MGILNDLFNLADDIVSIPTDLVGLTNHHEKKRVRHKLKRAFLNGQITAEEYDKAMSLLDS